VRRKSQIGPLTVALLLGRQRHKPQKAQKKYQTGKALSSISQKKSKRERLKRGGSRWNREVGARGGWNLSSEVEQRRSGRGGRWAAWEERELNKGKVCGLTGTPGIEEFVGLSWKGEKSVPGEHLKKKGGKAGKMFLGLSFFPPQGAQWKNQGR